MNLEVRDYLRAKNIDVSKTSGKELVVPCFFDCGETGNKRKLYINQEGGMFSCKVCGREGGWRGILEHFGDTDDVETFKPSRKLAIYNEYVTACQTRLFKNKEALTYLFSRGFTEETIEAARLGLHPRGEGIVEALPSSLKKGGFTREELRSSGLLSASGADFLQGRLIIPYISSGQVLQVRGRAMGDEKVRYATPPGDKVRLYNTDAMRGADAVMLCEGEMDCLMLQQTLSTSPDVRARNIGVVALPGVQSLPDGKEGFPAWFEDVRRVYVGFDNDNAGRQGAARVKEILGAKARVVELKEAEDWNDYLQLEGKGWSDVMAHIAEADMLGKRVFSVSEAAQKLKQLEEGKPGIKTGFASLDAYLKPGLMPGGITVPLAKTGVGKSVLLANMAWLTRTVPTLFVTLEMTAAETFNRLRRITRFHEPTIEDAEIGSRYPLLGIVEENRLGPEDFGILVEEFSEEKGERPQLVFVDYLGYYARGQYGRDQYEKTTNAIMQLKEEAKRHEVHIVTPGQVNRGVKPGEPITEQSARDAGSVEETSDFLLGVYRPWEATADAARPGAVSAPIHMSILKSRHGNKGRVARLAMSFASLAIVDESDRTSVARIELENAAINRGDSYEDIYRRDRDKQWAAQQQQIAINERAVGL